MIRATCLLLAAVSFTAGARADGLACTLADLDAHQSPPDRVQACLASGDFAGADPVKLQTALMEVLGAGGVHSTLKPDDRDVVDAEHALARLEDMHAARPSDHLDLYATYLENGKVDRAKAMVQADATPELARIRFPELVGLPAGRHESAAFWRLSADGRTLVEHDVDLKTGAHLLIVSSPGCHFCAAAADWVEHNPKLQSAFRKHALWMDRPDSNFDARYYATWDAAHPASPMSTIFDTSGWPMPEAWATPQFFFMKDGRIVTTVTGWMESSPEKIRAGFKSIGIDVPVAPAPPHAVALDDQARAELRVRHWTDIAMAAIRNPTDLANYLATHDVAQTPLGKLSEGGRQRFLKDLTFGPRGGLAGFPVTDLRLELTLSQLYDLLSLFGAQEDLPMFADARVESDRDRELVAILSPGVTPASK